MTPSLQFPDPLALASASPNVAALIEEFTRAAKHGPARVEILSSAEATRYNWWPGKSPTGDGVRRQRDQAQGVTVKPYDNRPDTEVNLADELVLTETDIDLFALEKAQAGAESTHLTAFTAAQIAEAKAMLRWIRKATAADLADGAELLSQIKNSAGWAVLQSGWREKWGLVERRVTMDEVFQAANAAFQAWQQQQSLGSGVSGLKPLPPSEREDSRLQTPDSRPPLVDLPQLIADPTTEDLAVEIVAGFLPHLKRAKVRTIVRDLRTAGEATFLDRQLEFKGPCLKARIPGVDIFCSGGGGDAQSARGWLEVDFYYEADLRARQLNAGWNEDFIEAAAATAGSISAAGRNLYPQRQFHDSEERRIEIWTAKVRQYDEDLGTTGIYCTVFSPHVSPGATPAGASGTDALPKMYYAVHYLQKAAHGQYPFDLARREVNGPKLEDSRGVPEMVRPSSNLIKHFQDAAAIATEWRANPTTFQSGSGWSKISEPMRPGAVITAPPGADVKPFHPEGDAKLAGELGDRIERSERRRQAIPNNGQDGDHPSLWQLRQSRQSARFLQCLRGAFWKLLVTCYEELTPQEIGQILGRPPLLKVSELLRCQVTLKFEPRSLDSDWVETVLKFITQIILWDKGGLIDTAPLMRIGLSYIDTTIIDEVLRSPAGAQAQLYRKVEGDITTIVLGNPPPLVEMDATAGMQLQMAMAVLQKNPKYARVIQSDEQVQENLKTYIGNLRHSQQETELSPQQGRLGVADMPQRPVSQGNALATAGTY